jgi:hypothetical protein
MHGILDGARAVVLAGLFGEGGNTGTIIMIVAMIAIFYFLMIWPEQ